MSVPNNKLANYMYMYLEKHGKIKITLRYKIIYTQWSALNRDKA